MRIVALPDLHGHTEQLSALGPVFEAADVILLPGDMTHGGRIGQITAVVDGIRQYNPHIFAVVGNMDSPIIEHYLDEQGINLHARHHIIDGNALVGLGGALPFFGSFEYNEDDFARFIDEALDGLPPDMPQILVSHNPPHKALDTVRFGKHVGSHSIRAYIEQHQPLICFTGHIHSARGIETIGRTQIVNPGPIWESRAFALAEVSGHEVVNLEIRAV